MALHLARSRHRSPTNPSLLHLFSTSSNDPNNRNATANGYSSADNHPSVSSYFGNAKANQQQEQQRPTNPSSTSSSFDEIRRNLSEFRRHSTVPPPSASSPTPLQSQPHFSFQESYKRKFLANLGEPKEGPGGKVSFDVIRNSMRKMGQNSGANNVEGKEESVLSLSGYMNTLKLKPSGDKVISPAIGGSLTPSIFQREMKDKAKGGEPVTKTWFFNMHSYEDLGNKLKQLRPPDKKKGEGWFSFQELNERLMKLRAIEEKEMEAKNAGISTKILRDSFHILNTTQNEIGRKTLPQRVEILEIFGRTPEHMMHPPKEHLVEKYFHPDNMSSAEKMKIELAKVRDEFKMSESDCGSARVQVAQLTTKIKHLSSVLHKKDKHSRKGLQAMVQKRKKLLKYLRRTDWDSYCFVLSKLGLRDTADSKN
ncbi:hypothetical protein V6N13_078893 [Hibiscus sabdariffa]|uniref:Small ribosomal subunit protein uS15c n=1 Tax=Hibiscus sabdariffa TaxID=183260 RepID=A0ABR2RPR9_9ROSI